jgi:8-oxo-dGTP pyrophosphatase MutT (NUDIX family)
MSDAMGDAAGDTSGNFAGNEISIGYIKRADQLGDKWAGHVAFPGGKFEPRDQTTLDTAIRETFEEIGVQLTERDHLGRLADIQARNRTGMLPFFIRPHVFVLYERPEVKLDLAEVASFDWVSLSWFLDPANRGTYSLAISNGALDLPAYRMPDQSLLWGLTYMMTEDFLKFLRQNDVLAIE